MIDFFEKILFVNHGNRSSCILHRKKTDQILEIDKL